MTTSLTIRMDETLKADAEEFFNDSRWNFNTLRFAPCGFIDSNRTIIQSGIVKIVKQLRPS